jgi:hypothetical protein
MLGRQGSRSVAKQEERGRCSAILLEATMALILGAPGPIVCNDRLFVAESGNFLPSGQPPPLVQNVPHFDEAATWDLRRRLQWHPLCGVLKLR